MGCKATSTLKKLPLVEACPWHFYLKYANILYCTYHTLYHLFSSDKNHMTCLVKTVLMKMYDNWRNIWLEPGLNISVWIFHMQFVNWKSWLQIIYEVLLYICTAFVSPCCLTSRHWDSGIMNGHYSSSEFNFTKSLILSKDTFLLS